MKVIDCVNMNINAYPSLYMLKNYEESTFAVLHHYFVVLGNGIEWAHTYDPKTGGYLTDPKYKEIYGEWVRVKNKPYGKEKYKIDPRAFKEKIFYFVKIDTDRSEKGSITPVEVYKYKTIFESDLKELKKKYRICESHIDYVHGFHTHYYYPVNMYSLINNPYPNFSKRFSCFWSIDPKFIQEDWRLAGINHLKHWQKYFNDKERVKGYHYYKNPVSLKKFITKTYKNNTKKYPDWIQSVRDNYEFQIFNGSNFEELANTRWKTELQKTKKFLSNTLKRLTI